jgi:homoserine dehydrogenase
MKNIGLFGFGCVGEGFYRLLQLSHYSDARIHRIVVKNPLKNRSVSSELITYNKEEILSDDKIDLIVEAIDDDVEAFEIVSSALKRGIPVVSANKKMVALHLDELIRLQRRYKTPLLYEAAVCGAIPVVQTVDDQFEFEPINSIRGIFNGTTNYILSRIQDERLDYEQALKQAQILGFAETDPISDVGGFDSAYKAIILSRHAFGLSFLPSEVFTYGIQMLTSDDFEFAQKQNLRVRLVPSVFAIENRVVAFVMPQFVSEKDPLFRIENENNAVVIDGTYSGIQTYTGRGAGSYPTAFSVFSDVRKILEGKRYHYPITEATYLQEKPENVILDVYLRYTETMVKRAIKFEFVREGFVDENYRYVTGSISLQELIDNRELLIETNSSVILLSDKPLLRKQVKRTLKQDAVLSVF